LSALASRSIIKLGKDLAKTSRITKKPFLNYYYPGGFKEKMNKREAALILGIRYLNLYPRENANTDEVKVAYKKIILMNHPDKGGSPFIASKITEAKNLMET
jgi:DnaJ homolog subfamily C member 15